MEALVLRVGLGVGIGHAHQDAGRALEKIGERLHEADGAARADHGRLLAEARLEGTARGLEGRPLGVGGPPRRGAFDCRGDLHAVGRLGGELLHDEAAGLARVHAGDGAEREPRAGRLDDLVGRAEERARLQRDHGERRPRPHALEQRELALAPQPHAGEHAGVLLELRLRQRQLPDARELLAAGARHLGVEAGHVQGAVRLAEVGDHGAEDLHGVGHGSTEAAVQRLMEALHLHVHLADAAELIGERGVTDVVVAGVGEHDEVRGHLRPVLLEEAAQVPRADLLLALDDELHVERERLGRPQVRADGGHVGHDPALVVGGAPAVETAVALGGLEGGREPLLRAAGGHHVVMPVEEHGGRARPV